MADSNSEPPRCPCGFFGRAETLGLCSKCYNDHMKKKTGQTESEKAPIVVNTEQISSAISKVSPLPSKDKENDESLPPQAEAAPAETPASSSDKESKETEEEKMDTVEKTEEDKEGTPEPSSSNGNKRDASELQEPDKPVQKNKKKCYKCHCKLQPAIREIGRCKCDYIFCQLHRLPEQHDCIYDHKGKGREEARGKMVSPKKHIGTSLKRIDSDS